MITDLKHFASKHHSRNSHSVTAFVFRRRPSVAIKLIDSPVYRIADQYKRGKGSILVEKHSIKKRQTDAKLKRIFSNGGDSRVGAHFSGAHII